MKVSSSTTARFGIAAITMLVLLSNSLLAQTPDSKGSEAELKEMRRTGYNLLYSGKVEEAQAAFEKMIAAHPDEWEGYYDMACFNLRADKLDPAVEWLSKAVDHGCDDYEFFSTDSDLRLIRTERPTEYRALLDRVQRLARERKDAEVKEVAARLAINLPKEPLYPFTFDLQQLLTDGRLALSDLAGKVVIVDIWGTWCPPCRKEVPHFAALYEKYRDSGLEIVGLNYEKDRRTGQFTDYEGARQMVLAEAKQIGVNYALLFGDPTTLAQVPGFRGFPTTLFIDHKGKVRVQEVGYKSLEELEPIVLSLLGEKMAADAAAKEGAANEGAAEEVAPKEPDATDPSSGSAGDK